MDSRWSPRSASPCRPRRPGAARPAGPCSIGGPRPRRARSAAGRDPAWPAPSPCGRPPRRRRRPTAGPSRRRTGRPGGAPASSCRSRPGPTGSSRAGARRRGGPSAPCPGRTGGADPQGRRTNAGASGRPAGHRGTREPSPEGYRDRRERPSDGGGRLDGAAIMAPMLESLYSSDDEGRARFSSRLAAFLFFGSGLLLLVNVPLPAPPDINRVGELVVGLAAMAVGGAVWRIRWERFHLLWQLVLVPPALALIALGNYFGGSNPPYAYGVFFVVVFMWIGLGFPRWTSVGVAPFALVAYIVPILYLPGNVGFGVSTAAITIPICVLVAETLAWGLSRIGRTEAALARTRQDYKQAFQSTRQYAQAYQRQMEVTERIRSSDRMRDTFLQAVSHDLRSPLTAILGSTSTLEQQGPGLSDA